LHLKNTLDLGINAFYTAIETGSAIVAQEASAVIVPKNSSQDTQEEHKPARFRIMRHTSILYGKWRGFQLLKGLRLKVSA